MRPWLAAVAITATSLAKAPIVFADDGGGLDAAAGGGADAAAIACNGNLCDTRQGRPGCEVASPSLDQPRATAGWMGGAMLVGLFASLRGVKRGTQRPSREAGSC